MRLDTGNGRYSEWVCIGQPETAVLACAGQPNQDVRTGELHILKYYKEGSLLEESRVSSREVIPQFIVAVGQVFS
jgi:hypothetical protein